MTNDDMIPAAADFLDRMIELEASFLDKWAGGNPDLARGAALLGLLCFFGEGRERIMANFAKYKLNPATEDAVWKKLEEGIH